MLPTLRIPAFVIVIVLAIAACSGAAGPTGPAVAPSAASAQAPAGASGSNAVAIKDLAFNPASITVKSGTKVTWTNNDSVTHTVTLDDNSVDSGNVTAGSTYDHIFAAVGSFAYHCKIHPSMLGTVVVTP